MGFPTYCYGYDLQNKISSIYSSMGQNHNKYMELTMLRHLILQCHNIVNLMSARLIYNIGIFYLFYYICNPVFYRLI
nr:MAG TPA: hypothetical protein [Caudoviricetes sp.]